MTDNNNDRQMYEGNWSCSKCGGAITQLPFQPDPAREGTLMCRDCHREHVGDKPRRDRQMFEGNWSCSKCGGAITQLPFQPDPSREGDLMCRDCYRK